MKLTKAIDFHKKYRYLDIPDRIEQLMLKKIGYDYERLKHKTDDPVELKFDIGEYLWVIRKTKRRLMIPKNFNEYLLKKLPYISLSSAWKYLRIRAFMNIYSYPQYKTVGIGCLYKIAVANKNRDIKYYIKRQLLPKSFDYENKAKVKEMKKEISHVAEAYKKPKKEKIKRIPLTQILMRLDKLYNILSDISRGQLIPYEKDKIDYQDIKTKAKIVYSEVKGIKNKIRSSKIKIEY